MKPIQIAMLSLDHAHTRKYFQTLKDNRNFEWVAVTAENQQIKDDFESKGYNVPCYLDEDEMFKNHPEIEAVVMCSVNRKHIEQFRGICPKGIHILCMKIPTFDMQEYDEMISLVSEHDIVCQVELELHYNPVVLRLKKLMDTKVLGEVSTINGTNITLCPVYIFPWHWHGSPEECYGKRIALSPGDHRFRGGCISDHPHVFDMIRWLAKSEFDFVFAEAGPNLRDDLEVEDTVLVTGKMKNGVSFIIDPSWSRHERKNKQIEPGWQVDPKRMEVNFTVSGDQGVLLADCFGPNVYHNGIPTEDYIVHYTYFDEWIGMMDEFADCIRNKKRPTINLQWHKKTIEAMNACYDSISSGTPILL